MERMALARNPRPSFLPPPHQQQHIHNMNNIGALNTNSNNRMVDGQPTQFCSPVNGLFGTTIDLGVDLAPVRQQIFQAKLTYHRELWKIICERGMQGEAGWQQRSGGGGGGGGSGEGGGGEGGGEAEEAEGGEAADGESGEENKSNQEVMDFTSSNSTGQLGAGVVTVRHRHGLRMSWRQGDSHGESAAGRATAVTEADPVGTAPSYPRSERSRVACMSTRDTAVATQLQQQQQQQSSSTEAAETRVHSRARAEFNMKSYRRRLFGDLMCSITSSHGGSSSNSVRSSRSSINSTTSSSNIDHRATENYGAAAPSSVATSKTSKKFVPFYCGDWSGAADVGSGSGSRQHHRGKRSASRKRVTHKSQEVEDPQVGDAQVGDAQVGDAQVVEQQWQNHNRHRSHRRHHHRRSSSRGHKNKDKKRGKRLQ